MVMDTKEFKKVKKSYDNIPIVKFKDDDIPMIYIEDIVKPKKKKMFVVFGMENLTHLDEVWSNFYNNYRKDEEDDK
jgi:predicted metal-binding protein